MLCHQLRWLMFIIETVSLSTLAQASFNVSPCAFLLSAVLLMFHCILCRLRCNLLTNFTRINWDQGMSDTCASGEILSAKAGLQQFEFSTDALGEAGVTDALWRLIG